MFERLELIDGFEKKQFVDEKQQVLLRTQTRAQTLEKQPLRSIHINEKNFE
jgi:hypothetical protein